MGSVVLTAAIFFYEFRAGGVTWYSMETMAELKNQSVGPLADKDVALLLGYYASGDRGGGWFVWRTNETHAADDGLYVTPSSNPKSGRWIRLLQGQTPNVKMWGAAGDKVRDDWQSIQNAIKACSYGQSMELLFTSGAYRITNTLVFPGQLHLRGEGLWDNTEILMAPGINKDIFRTENANIALTGGNPGWDNDMIFENISMAFDGAKPNRSDRNTKNACLVVCKPGEGSVIRTIQTGNGAFGIRCVGVGSPGLRVRDVQVSDAAVAGICIEPLADGTYASGGPVSLVGISGDSRFDDSSPSSSLIRFTNVVCAGRICDVKAEGTFGGGVIRYDYASPSLGYGVGPMGTLIIENCKYNGGQTYGNLQFPRDFIVLSGARGYPLTLNGFVLTNVRYLINDLTTGRTVEPDVAPLAYGTARIPLSYESVANNFSRLVAGQTALAHLYATNVGWYRVMQPLGIGTTRLCGKLVISAPGQESTELQVAINPQGSSGAWFQVNRALPATRGILPVVTQARGVYGYDKGFYAFVDVYVGNTLNYNIPAFMKRITFALDINGLEVTGTGQTQLVAPIVLAPPLPPGAKTSVVDLFQSSAASK